MSNSWLGSSSKWQHCGAVWGLEWRAPQQLREDSSSLKSQQQRSAPLKSAPLKGFFKGTKVIIQSRTGLQMPAGAVTAMATSCLTQSLLRPPVASRSHCSGHQLPDAVIAPAASCLTQSQHLPPVAWCSHCTGRQLPHAVTALAASCMTQSLRLPSLIR